MVRTLQALTARLQSVREEERTHIAREIHDELGQQLTAMRFDLISLRNRQMQASAKGEPAAVLSGRFSDLVGMIDGMIADVRRIATELRPAILDTFGLNAAVEWLAEDFQKRTKISCVYEGVDELAGDGRGSLASFRQPYSASARSPSRTSPATRGPVKCGFVSRPKKDGCRSK